MIKDLYIQNYQSHKATSLEFVPGVNAIIGSSDSGKTAIVRALNWAVKNKPAGEEFRSTWGGDTIVSVSVDEQTVSRVRTNTKNDYLIDEEVLKAFGREPPQEVTDLLNFSDLNIQFQLDSPFLLSSSAGETARYLNELINLEKIDQSLFTIAKKRRETSSAITRNESQLKILNDELKAYGILDEIEQQLETLENLYNEAQLARQKQYKLRQLIADAVSFEQSLEQYKDLDAIEREIKRLQELSIEIKVTGRKQSKLQVVVGNIKSATDALNDAEKILKAERGLNFLLQLEEEVAEVKQKREHLSSLSSSISEAEQELKAERKVLADYIRQEKELMPEKCPLCGQVVKKR